MPQNSNVRKNGKRAIGRKDNRKKEAETKARGKKGIGNNGN
jgi:hypothetical protein